MAKSKILLIIGIVFLAVFSVVISYSGRKQIHKMEASNSSHDMDIMALGLAEISNSESKYKIRITTPVSHSSRPLKLTILYPNGNNPLTLELFPATNAYICHDTEDFGNNRSGFETEWFNEGVGDDLDTDINVELIDQDNQITHKVVRLSHMCNLFSEDFGVVVTGTPDLGDIPSE
jgi:hypothetical protein